MARVKLENITRRYGGTTAVEGITFEVPDGQFWVMVGPSGCGKSTILRTIAGLETATSGNLYIGDHLVNQVPARQRDVAMVFQNYALYPHMSVAENLAFGLQMRRVNSNLIRDRVEAVARSLDMSHLLERKPQQLSGGQQQRVALGRAIIRQPQAFLLDEPLSNLDAQLRDDTRAELKQLHQKLGITTIYVTHDQVEAMTLADRIVVLDRGRIQQIGEPQSIYAKPINRMVATFLGSPPMNLIPALYDDHALQVNGQTLHRWEACPSLASRKSYDLGIRPEHLHVVDATLPADLTVTVTVVEPLGRETLVRATLPGTVINLQIPADHQVSPGDSLNLQVDFEHLFIFDAETGQRLHPPGI
jgi:multiple sugar transport system ATP-binding protein